MFALLLLLSAQARISAAQNDCTPLATPAIIYVDEEFSGTPDGSSIRPWRKISDAASRARPGDRIYISPGLYREAILPTCSGTIAAGRIAFERWPDRVGEVVVSGAEPANAGWRAEGDAYRLEWDPPNNDTWNQWLNSNRYFGFTAEAFAQEWRVFRRELIIAFNPASGRHEPLRPVYDPADLQTGTFYVQTAGACTPELAFDSPQCKPSYILARFWGDRTPAQARPEIGVRPHIFRGVGNSDNPTLGGRYVLRNLVLRFANSGVQDAALCLNWVGDVGCSRHHTATNGERVANLGTGGLVEDVTVERANARGLDVSGQGHVFRRVYAVSNGQLGMGGSCDYCLIVDGAASYNNWKGYDAGFGAGGTKFDFMNGTTIRRLRASANRGPGIWLDGFNTNNVVEGCLAYANYSAGIFLEYKSDRNLIQHNIATFTYHVGASEASGFLQRSSRRNFIYHNSFFNNRLQGIFLNDDARLDDTDQNGPPYTPLYTDYEGHDSWAHNNLMIANGMESIFPDSIDVSIHGGREIQIEDRCRLGREAVRTNNLGGNVYYNHIDDPNYLQGDSLFMTFRVRPDTPEDDVDCSDYLNHSFSTNVLREWRGVTEEGPNSYTVNRVLVRRLGVDVLRLGEPGPNDTPNPYWPLLDFPAPSTVACLPSCGANPQCAQHPYAKVGANLDAVFGTWLSDTPPIACRDHGQNGSAMPAVGDSTIGFNLAPAAPNPFGTATTFRLDLPEAARVEISVHDAIGRRVRVLDEGDLVSGTHLLPLDAAGLADGIYLVRAVVTPHGAMPPRSFTQRVALLR